MKYYYVLWIPSVERGCPEIIESKLDEITLRDDEAYDGVVLSGSISDNFRIDITYHLVSKGIEKHIYLDNEKRDDDTGFLVYSLTIHDEQVKCDFFLEGLKEEMPTALYHYIKGFFHKHVNHASEADSKLKAYHFKGDIFNFEQYRNAVIESVLSSYEDLFSGQVGFVRYQLRDALEALAEDRNKFRYLDILDKLAVATNNALGEISYCEFLLGEYSDIVDNGLSKRIRQSIQTLKNDYQQLLFWNNHFHARFSYSDGIHGVRWGVTGVIISFLSLIMAIVLPLLNHSEERIIRELENNSKQIEMLKDSISGSRIIPSESCDGLGNCV